MNEFNINDMNYEHDFVLRLAKPGLSIFDSMLLPMYTNIENVPQLDFNKDAAHIVEKKMHLLHMSIGVMGEVAEFIGANTDAHIKEELGDATFYMVGAISRLNLPSWYRLEQWKNYGAGNKDNLVIAAGDFLDQVKKYVVYNDQSRERELGMSSSYLQVWEELIPFIKNNFNTRQELIDNNVNKLAVRYGKTFQYSDVAAKTRADKVEH